MFPKLSAVFAVAVIRKRNAREEKKTTILLILEIFLDISYNTFIMCINLVFLLFSLDKTAKEDLK